MTIWDDLYQDLIKVELKQDGISAQSSESFKTVEAKVDELRKRVGLNDISEITKQASLLKAAADPEYSKKLEQCAIDCKSYIAEFVDKRRTGTSVNAILENIKSTFQHSIELVRELEDELREYAQKHLDKYEVKRPAPVPILYIKPEGSSSQEDNKIFENIADKLKN